MVFGLIVIRHPYRSDGIRHPSSYGGFVRFGDADAVVGGVGRVLGFRKREAGRCDLLSGILFRGESEIQFKEEIEWVSFRRHTVCGTNGSVELVLGIPKRIGAWV